MRRSRSRLLVAAAGACSLGGCGVGFLVHRGLLGLVPAVQLSACAAVLAATLLVVFLLRRTDRQVRRLRSGLDRQVRDISEIAGENRAELIGRADELVVLMGRVEERLKREAVPCSCGASAGRMVVEIETERSGDGSRVML